MTAMITDKVIHESDAAAEVPAAEAGRLHRGPVARLLARAARMSGEYADYQMEAGVWRKLAI